MVFIRNYENEQNMGLGVQSSGVRYENEQLCHFEIISRGYFPLF